MNYSGRWDLLSFWDSKFISKTAVPWITVDYCRLPRITVDYRGLAWSTVEYNKFAKYLGVRWSVRYRTEYVEHS